MRPERAESAPRGSLIPHSPLDLHPRPGERWVPEGWWRVFPGCETVLRLRVSQRAGGSELREPSRNLGAAARLLRPPRLGSDPRGRAHPGPGSRPCVLLPGG